MALGPLKAPWWVSAPFLKYLDFPAAAAKSLQSCPTLCYPVDGSPPGSPIPGILQARTLEWVAISFSNAWKWKVESEVTQLCPTPSDPMDCSLPGSSVHGIFQARVLEWVVIAFSINVQYKAVKLLKENIEQYIIFLNWTLITWPPSSCISHTWRKQTFRLMWKYHCTS